jgi:hypothetical protein
MRGLGKCSHSPWRVLTADGFSVAMATKNWGEPMKEYLQCPYCGSSVRKGRFNRHKQSICPKRPPRQPKPLTKPTLEKCLHCACEVRPDRMKRHEAICPKLKRPHAPVRKKRRTIVLGVYDLPDTPRLKEARRLWSERMAGSSDSPSLKKNLPDPLSPQGARCRLCRKNQAMYGADVCYTCNTK